MWRKKFNGYNEIYLYLTLSGIALFKYICRVRAGIKRVNNDQLSG